MEVKFKAIVTVLAYNGAPSSLPKLLVGVPPLLNSSESPSEPPSDSSDVDPADQQKAKWSLTQEAFDKLLSHFSTDRNQSGFLHETARRKLVRFFEWRSFLNAEDYADEVMNRVARRIDEGQVIDNLMAYIWGVARIVLKEALKERERAPLSMEDSPGSLRLKAPVPVEPDARELCLEQCLQNLDEENRRLILGYYAGERREKINNRQQLADELQIPMNALRIRAHRIRKTLETCIAECLKKEQARNS